MEKRNKLNGSLLSLWFLSLLVSIGRDIPENLASTARLDLSADTSVASLANGQFIAGFGSITRKNWETNQTAGYTVAFPITHFAPREVSLRFTPLGSGTVALSLMGPYEKNAEGAVLKQEIVWEQISITGAKSDGPSAGMSNLRSWHDAPLRRVLRVAGGKPVTIQARARAVIPAGFQEMRRIEDTNSPAHQALQKFLRGANLGNYLEAPPNQNWGATYSARDFLHLRGEGFDHARLPIAWHHYSGSGPEFKLSAEIFSKVDFLVTNAIANHLAVIVNLHHFDSFTAAPAANTNKFYAIWRQVAAHYARYPAALAFEILNEPKDAATTTLLNPIYAETIRLIRESNPNRTIFVGPGRWNSIDELTQLKLPDDDRNLVVTVHCYEPFYFTHQGATWSGPETKITGIQFPGPPSRPLVPGESLQPSANVAAWLKRYNSEPRDINPSSPAAFRPKLQSSGEWSAYYGRPVHVGEFGCYIKADPESRVNFYREFRKGCEEFGLAWAIWDWKAGFKYWDDQADRALPGMHEALFGAKGR